MKFFNFMRNIVINKCYVTSVPVKLFCPTKLGENFVRRVEKEGVLFNERSDTLRTRIKGQENRNVYILSHIIWYNKVLQMAKMLIELSKEEDKIVEMYKLVHELKTKQEAVKQMIKYFQADVKPKNLKEKDYFSV